ncbi:alpha/beta hydrolase fold domain-containing protein [Rhodococcus sp. GA1]|uniref:alpha/beta hydrolase fold domain-containing protein n=1 Tax=Rhodococcus sp. GA1 TaxID=2942275 RepID=UPI0020CF3735|nr:alpha/beta hydrolase fold domain-containing protein [Rhodococcus sp. GA1]
MCARTGSRSTSGPARRYTTSEVHDLVVDGPGGGLALRLYRLESSEAARPVVVFAHGGGFVFCDLDSHDEFCRSMAIATCDRGGPAVLGQALFYPVIDDDFDTESYRKYGVGYYNSAAAMRWYWEQYAPDGTDDPRLIPTRAESLAGLPSAVVATAELDPPCSSGDDYADRLAAAGVSVQHRRFDGLFHGFLTFPALSLSEPARQEVRKMVRALVDGPDLPVTGTSGFAS